MSFSDILFSSINTNMYKCVFALMTNEGKDTPECRIYVVDHVTIWPSLFSNVVST